MHIQDILALPRIKQIAIVQAILAQWEAEEGTENGSLLERHADAATQIAAEVDAGHMPVMTLDAWREQTLPRRNANQP
jgi:hypothetical protein